MQIVQNALWLVKKRQILISAYRHDYVTAEVDGKDIMLDGGTAYFKCSGPIEELIQDGKVIDLRLTDESPEDEIKHKIIWGTHGKDGKLAETRWVFLKNCDDAHLEKILQFPYLCKIRKRAINQILEDRKNGNIPKIPTDG
jgi:hypothetical protein